MRASSLGRFGTIVRKETTRIVRIWVQTLVPPVITMTLYFVIFGNLIGPRIGEMGGFDYMQYIAPGLIMMSVITNSYGNVVSSFFGAKFGKHLKEMIVAPMQSWVIILGHVAGGIIRGLAVGVGRDHRGAVLHRRPGAASAESRYRMLVLTAMVFSLGGMINAIFARKFDDVSIIPTFVLRPLTYLGGVFFSVSLLPGVWQSISLVNPIVYMVSAFRYGLLGISDIPLWIAYAIVCGFGLVLFVICMSLLKRGVGLRS